MAAHRFFLYASVFGVLAAGCLPAVAQTSVSYEAQALQPDGSLQQQIEELREENRRIAQSLAVASAKALTVDRQEQEWQEKMAVLQQKLEQIEAQNVALKAQTQEAAQAPSSGGGDNVLAMLKKRNAGLLKTIDQQNNMLESLMKYESLARDIKEENDILREKLENSALSGAVDVELEKENKRLKEAVAQRDEFIKRMEILKVAAQGLKAENERLESELRQARESALPVVAPTAPDQVNNASQQAENKYKDIMVEYRKKIRFYQEQVAQLQTQLQAGAMNNIETAAGGRDDEIRREHKVTALQMENQELRARLKLLMDRQSSALFQDGMQQAAQDSAGEGGAFPVVVMDENAPEEAIHIVSAKAEIKTSASALKSVPGTGEDGQEIVYKVPPESMEMLKERGVLE